MPTAMPAFNTLRYADELKAAGVPDAQARVTVQMVADALDANLDRLATKDDIRVMGMELRGEMTQEFATLRGEMHAMHASLQGQINTLKWMSSPVALVALVWIAKESLKVFGVAG